MNEFNSNPASSKHISVFSLIIIFNLSMFAGLIVSFLIMRSINAVPDNAPVSKELLENQMISSWSAVVKGRVVEKTGSTFIITHIIEELDPVYSIRDVNDGKTMEITYTPEKTVFLFGSSGQKISLDELAVGSIIRGYVTIVKSGVRQEMRGEVFSVKK